MIHRVHSTLAVAGLVLGGAFAVPAAEAQVRGIPVYNSGIPTGIGIYGDVGFPNVHADNGYALAVSGRAGFGPLGATATFSTYNPEGPVDNKVSVGGTLNYKIFGGPLIPLSVTLQGGIGYAKPETGLVPDLGATNGEVNEFRFPLGVGLALTIPNPALAIKPWIAPRVDIVRYTGDVSDTQTNFGLGGGLELNLLSGLGVHAAYDRVFRDGGDPSVFGVGAHYTFRVPGL
jgi:hypothetical protein